MTRLDATKLIQLLLTQEARCEIKFILSDNPVFLKLAEGTGEKKSVFQGKSAVKDYVDYAASGSLFFALKPALIILPEKLTQKQWGEEKKYLQRLPQKLEASCTLFAPLSLRTLFKENELPKHWSLYLCYEPNESEKLKCAELLAQRYGIKTQYAHQALEYYSGDLLSCDMHFARMAQGELNFNAALAGTPEINGFHVVEALAKGEIHAVEQRLLQCAQCGEDATSVFTAILYFMKQLAQVIVTLNQENNLKNTFSKLYIPYPAQAKLESALKHFSLGKVTLFLATAAQIEIELRQQKNGHQYLAAELLMWLQR